jgi:hypothetical protein
MGLSLCWGCGALNPTPDPTSDPSSERRSSALKSSQETEVSKLSATSSSSKSKATKRSNFDAVEEIEEIGQDPRVRSRKRASTRAKNVQKRVAILELRNRARIRPQEISYLTDLIRKNAAVLPRDKFTVITRENIIAMLPPDVDLDSCIGECEVETGRRIGSHWLITGDVVKFGKALRITLKLHHSTSGELRGSSIVKGSIVEELERPMRRAMLELLSELTPTIKAPSKNTSGMMRFQLPEVDLDLIQDAEPDEDLEFSETLVSSKIKPIQMKTNLQELNIEALQKLDLAVRGEKSETVSPQEKISRWEEVKRSVPEAKARAQERIAIWKRYLDQRRQNTRKRFNRLDQRRRKLIVKANEISQRFSKLAQDLETREQACSQSLGKLTKVIGLELFSKEQKAEYTLDFARECAPFGDHINLLERAPYQALLKRAASSSETQNLKRSAEDARAHLKDAQDKLREAYQLHWGQVLKLQLKIDKERQSEEQRGERGEDDELSKLIKTHVNYKGVISSSKGQPESLPIGTRIVRGPDWKWGNQDGGDGEVGETIQAVQSDQWVRVKWKNGTKNTYRWGKSGKYDLKLVSPKADQLHTSVSGDPKILTFAQEAPLLGDSIYQTLKQGQTHTARRSGLKKRAAFSSSSQWSSYMERHLKPGMRVKAIRSISGNRQNVPVGATGIFYEGGHTPPAFVVWDDYAPDGCFIKGANGAPKRDNGHGWCSDWDDLEPL